MNPYQSPELHVCEKCLERKASDAIGYKRSRVEEMAIDTLAAMMLATLFFVLFFAVQMYGHWIVLTDQTVNESIEWKSFPWK